MEIGAVILFLVVVVLGVSRLYGVFIGAGEGSPNSGSCAHVIAIALAVLACAAIVAGLNMRQ